MLERHPERGQTLIELVVVCGILGLALLITAPNLTGYMHTQSVKKGLDAIASQIDLARERSVAHRIPVEFVLRDPDESQFWSYEDANRNGSFDNGEKKYGPFALPKGVTFDEIRLGGDSRLVFEPSGTLQSGQGGPLTLLDCNGHSMTLTIMASGMAELPRGPAQ